MSRLFLRAPGAESDHSPRAVGAFLGSVPGSLDRATAMETWLGLPLDCQTVFVPWDDRPAAITELFDGLRAIWDAGRLPLLTWELFTPTPAATPPDVISRALSGEYDAYLESWTSALADWCRGPDGELGTDDDRRLHLRPLHEPNGDWYPWAPAGSSSEPSAYVRLWRSLHRRLSRAGLDDHVNWIWAVNHVDAGDVTAESLFPGDDAVDMIGVDGFNWGASRSWSEWRAPAAVFEEMFDRVRTVSDRPLCVPEFGCTSATVDGTAPARKGVWLREAFEFFREEDVVLAAYFDVEKETDWQVFGGSHGKNTIRVGGVRYQTYPGFRNGVHVFRESEVGGRSASETT